MRSEIADQKSELKKYCTTCLQNLPSSEFYSKGKRLDSVCKECKKKKSKATYVREKKTSPITELNRLIDLMKELEFQALDDLEKKIIKLINERKKYDSIEHRSLKKVA